MDNLFFEPFSEPEWYWHFVFKLLFSLIIELVLVPRNGMISNCFLLMLYDW